MTLSLVAYQADPGEAVYFDEGWQTVVETHLPILRLDTNTQALPIDPHDAYMFRGDFFSLMQVYKIPAKYHYIALRANNLTSPMDYREDMINLIMPGDQIIESLRKIYQTLSSKTN